MNLNQLIYASEINRLGSFSRAAQTLFISQSALSKSIHSLEVELEQEPVSYTHLTLPTIRLV